MTGDCFFLLFLAKATGGEFPFSVCFDSVVFLKRGRKTIITFFGFVNKGKQRGCSWGQDCGGWASAPFLLTPPQASLPQL